MELTMMEDPLNHDLNITELVVLLLKISFSYYHPVKLLEQ